MNLFQLFDDIEKVDGDMAERVAFYTRRNWLKMSKKVAATVAAPTVLAASLNDAYGQASQAAVVDVLNYALTLEYLEDDYYKAALNSSVAIAGIDQIVRQISKHETAHVNLLKGALGSSAVAKPTFKFGDSFATQQSFLALAQALEDTGVRAYKGQAGSLLGTDALTTALQIHSVEARHAAMIRRLRSLKGWISDPAEQPAAVYAGEDITTQAGVALPAATGKDAARVREAFDEPLTRDQVLAIARPYIG